MSEILPLSYITPAASRTLSGGLLTSQTSTGSVGAWATPQAISVLDPAKTYTTAELIDTYNAAVWGLYKSGALITEPLIGFNEMSYGVDIQVNGGTALEYRYGSNTCKVSTILATLNTLLTGTGVSFMLFQRKQVLMRVPVGVTLTFGDPNGSLDGTGLRFLRKLLGSTLEATVTGPTVINGPELDAPFIGVYPAPAGVSNLRATGVTSTSITIEWDPSPTAGVRYLVTRSGSTQKNYTTNTSWTYTGLTPTTAYTVRVRTLTDNAISIENNSFAVTTVSIPVPVLISAIPGQDTITVGANSQQDLDPQVVNIVLRVYLEDSTEFGGDRLYSPTATSMIVTGLTPDVLYYIRGRYRLNDGTDGAFSSYVSAPTFTPAPDLVNAGPTTPSSLRVSWTPNSLFDIRLDLIRVSDGFVIDTVVEPASIGSYTFSGLLENTEYSVSATYNRAFGSNPDGPTTTIYITTILQPASFGPTDPSVPVDQRKTNASHWDAFYLQYSPGVTATIAGISIPAESSYLGFKFNRFYMPVIANGSLPYSPYRGQCGTLTNLDNGGNSLVRIRVLDKLKNLIAETTNLKAYNYAGGVAFSNTGGAIPSTNAGTADLSVLWPYGYEFIFPTLIEMTEGMYILVESLPVNPPYNTYGNELRLRWYNSGGSGPLRGVQNTASDYNALVPTNNVLLCYFAKV